MASETSASTATRTDDNRRRLHLIGGETPMLNSTEESLHSSRPYETTRDWVYAGPARTEDDPDRFEAANRSDWDYARGNPFNVIKAGHNVAIRPFNSTFVFFRIQGVNLMGVCTRSLCSAFSQRTLLTFVHST